MDKPNPELKNQNYESELTNPNPLKRGNNRVVGTCKLYDTDCWRNE